jgi:RHS repeat-associated protein
LSHAQSLCTNRTLLQVGEKFVSCCYAYFSLTALDTKLLLDIFNTAKKVVKFKLRFFTQTRDILTHVSEILPCFGLKGCEFLMQCGKLLLRYHTIQGGIEFLLRYHSLHDNSQDFSDVLKLAVSILSFGFHESHYTLFRLLQAKGYATIFPMRSILPRSCSYAGTGFANPHAVTEIGNTGGATTTYVYDNNGNVTSSTGRGFQWDYRNRLTAAGAAGATTTYSYDHENQRVQKTGSSSTTTYVNRYYNVASTSGNATATKHIFTSGGELLATVVGTSSAATTTYLHLDHLGGTNVATDGNQATSQVLDYYPYGSQRIATGSFSEQRRFIGEEYDLESSLSYLNARYYEGSRGQFLSQDPVFLNMGVDRRTPTALADPQLQNAYAYARNNPVALRDPEGEFLFVPVALALLMASQLVYYHNTRENVQVLRSPTASSAEKDRATNRFFFDLGMSAVSVATVGSVSTGDMLLRAEIIAGETLPLLVESIEGIYGSERLYGELDKKARNEQVRQQPSVTVTGSSGGSGGMIYSYPAPSQNGHGRASGQAIIGLSGRQQSAINSLVGSLNAKSFDAQAFVNSLNSVLKAFEVK